MLHMLPLHLFPPCWQALRCELLSARQSAIWQGLGCAVPPALHIVSSSAPPHPLTLPRLGSLSVFIFFSVSSLFHVHPLAVAVVVTECSFCPATLHQCHPLRQSLARQQKATLKWLKFHWKDLFLLKPNHFNLKINSWHPFSASTQRPLFSETAY